MKVNYAGSCDSSVDYPDGMSTVIFFNGCNRKCDYCQNMDMLKAHNMVNLVDVMDVINRSRWDTVVFSGGECTLQFRQLHALATYAKMCDKRVCIETNGSNPSAVTALVRDGVLDIIYCDINFSIPDPTVLELLYTNPGRVHFRSTVFDRDLTDDNIRRMNQFLPRRCEYTYTLQQGQPTEWFPVSPTTYDMLVQTAERIRAPSKMFVFTKSRGLREIERVPIEFNYTPIGMDDVPEWKRKCRCDNCVRDNHD